MSIGVWAAVVAAVAGARTGSPPQDAERHLLILRNDRVVVGIAPRLAGRIVLFRTPDGVNALDADPRWWAPEAKLPALAAGWDFPAINGWVVWTGPQKEWWLHQDISEEWKAKAYNWPPDPWTEWAPFEAADLTSTSATMKGPVSPVTGLALKKRIDLAPDGRVRISVTAANGRDREVRWDIWSNARLKPTARVWIPVSGNIRLDHGAAADARAGALDYEVRDGWFRFLEESPVPEGGRMAKAFLTPAKGIIASFDGGRVFLRRFYPTPAASVAPDQGSVEYFRRLDRDPAKALCELEIHGPYTGLPPNGTMTVEETWELRPFEAGAGAAAQAAWLKTLGDK